MAKKKKLKLTKTRRKQLVRIAIPLVVGLACFVIGLVGGRASKGHKAPTNLVWAADNSVVVPSDLRTFLEAKQDCQAYRGAGSPTGVGLWGVYQVVGGRYAKIAYGCSWNLSTYIMAVKQKNMWTLVPLTKYFAPFKDGVDPSKGALPYCTVLQEYTIPKAIEPFCILPDGSAQANPH